MANIVPDRNWNFADPTVRAAKSQKMDEFVAKLGLDLPINVGTEMNSPGSKKIDDFDVPEMEKHRAAFLDRAYFIYGHTIMQRHLAMGYQSPGRSRPCPRAASVTPSTRPWARLWTRARRRKRSSPAFPTPWPLPTS